MNTQRSYQNRTLPICEYCGKRVRSDGHNVHGRLCTICNKPYCCPGHSQSKVCSEECRRKIVSRGVSQYMKQLDHCDLCGRRVLTNRPNKTHKRICLVCGKIFCKGPHTYERLTCSEECRQKSRVEKLAKSYPRCSLCKEPSLGGNRHNKICVVCRTPFCGQGETCSKKCATSLVFPLCDLCNGRIRPGSRLHKMTCCVCNKLFCSTYKRRTCSTKCRYTLVSQSTKGHFPREGSGWGKGGYFDGVYMRSTWERNFARVLNLQGRKWQYENFSFKLADGSAYHPDFYVDGFGFVEIKGFQGEGSPWKRGGQQKVASFRSEYPQTKLKVIGRRGYKLLRAKYRSQIPDWEPDGLYPV